MPLLLMRREYLHTFMLQICILANHQNGRDTHIRQIDVYGPRECAPSIRAVPITCKTTSDLHAWR